MGDVKNEHSDAGLWTQMTLVSGQKKNTTRTIVAI